jgi:O-antigen ligase
MYVFILCVIFCALLKIPAAHMSGETTARQEHGIYTELSKREPGMIARFLFFYCTQYHFRELWNIHTSQFQVYMIYSYSMCIASPLFSKHFETS